MKGLSLNTNTHKFWGKSELWLAQKTTDFEVYSVWKFLYIGWCWEGQVLPAYGGWRAGTLLTSYSALSVKESVPKIAVVLRTRV